MRLRRRAVIFVGPAALATLVACGGGSARDQWTIRLTTDAPVPQLVDRALVEILDGTGALACEDCQRQLGLPVDATAWPISFGIAKPDSSRSLHVRVRFYRATRSGNDGLPLASSAIDALAALPAPSGETTLSLVMHADCVGVASDPTSMATCMGSDRSLVPAPMLTTTAPDDALRPGAWGPAKEVPCSGAPDAMVCVPGGFFVLGDATSFTATEGISAIVPERFVTVSPFGLDRTEMTVGAVRALVRAGKLKGAPEVQDAAVDIHSQCTYPGPDDATNDALPLSCATHDLATEVCAALGKPSPRRQNGNGRRATSRTSPSRRGTPPSSIRATRPMSGSDESQPR